MSQSEQILSFILAIASVIVVWLIASKLILQLRNKLRLSSIRAMKTGRYALQPRIFNNSEYFLHRELVSQLSSSYLIYTKIRVEDFIRCVISEYSDKQMNWSLRGRIKSRHVDFLICSLEGVPLHAIELDGPSHQSIQTQERDRFLDGVYEEVGLPYTHILVGSNFRSEVMNICQKLKK